MKGMKTRHLALGIAVIACGLGVYDRLAVEPVRRRDRDAWESRLQSHEGSLRMLPVTIEDLEGTAATCAALAEKWAGRSRPDLADHYRREAALWSKDVDFRRRQEVWHRARLDAIRAMAGRLPPEEIAAEARYKAEVEQELAVLGAEWKRFRGDMPLRPTEDLEVFTPWRTDPRLPSPEK